MAPVNIKGQYNQSAIAQANKIGGVNAVKNFYNTIHLRANDNSLPDDERKQAIEQCYGINLRELPSNDIQSGVNETTCIPQTMVPSMTGTPKDYGTIELKDNWIWSFSITPSGVVPNEWASLFLVNQGGAGNRGSGARAPALYFAPGTTKLHVSIVGKNNQICETAPNIQLPLNKTTNVYISYIDGKITLKYTGAVESTSTISCPGCPTGPATFYATSPWNPSFIGTITNLSFCTFQSKTKSVLDYRPGRTKTSLEQINYKPTDWSKLSKPAVVLAPYGGGPWGKWWTPNFPDDGTAKWIWTFASAINDEPNWGQRQFYKRYVNNDNKVYNATLTIAADNIGSVFVNDALISPNFSGTGSWNVILPPGENKIQINASNQGGPAGVIAIAKADNKTLFTTDNSWTFA
jgi:hypothetical protein